MYATYKGAMVTVFSTTNAFAAERKYEIQSSNTIITPYWDSAELIDATVSFDDGEYTGYKGKFRCYKNIYDSRIKSKELKRYIFGSRQNK